MLSKFKIEIFHNDPKQQDVNTQDLHTPVGNIAKLLQSQHDKAVKSRSRMVILYHILCKQGSEGKCEEK